MRAAERERRRRVYRAWAAEHSQRQVGAVMTTVVILETMPNPSFAVSVLTRVLRRIATDLAAVVAGTDQAGPPAHDWIMPHTTGPAGVGGRVGCPPNCPHRIWTEAHA